MNKCLLHREDWEVKGKGPATWFSARLTSSTTSQSYYDGMDGRWQDESAGHICALVAH